MPTVAVYRFRYIDRGGRPKESDDFATLEAIAQIKAEPLLESMLEVNRARVAPNGMLKIESGGHT